MKISKIKEHGREVEAKKLRDEGHGWIEISNIFNKRYPEDGGYSHMAIKRGLDAYGRGIVEQMIGGGENPIVELDNEFRKELKKIIRRTSKFMDIAEEMTEKAREKGVINDMSKALTTAFKGLAEERRGWESLHNSTFGQMKNIGDVNLMKEQKIIILLNNWADQLIKLKKELCDKCKKKVDDLLDELLENK